MSRPPHFLIVSDGKKGHENQSLGLVKALLRRVQGSYEITSSTTMETISKRPIAVVAAGHRTHLTLLRLGWRYRCPTVVIMKPSLPTRLFAHCFIPEHDLLHKKTPQNVTLTKGALNSIPEEIPTKNKEGLLMLGGPSKHFQWQEDVLQNAIEAIVEGQNTLSWTVGDSRRTPEGTLTRLQERLSGRDLTFVAHQAASGDWLRNNLLAAQEAWITPDSTSMLFEALTAGCRVGTFPLIPNDTRLSAAHEKLISEDWITPYNQALDSQPLPPLQNQLHETARCAELLLRLLRLN